MDHLPLAQLETSLEEVLASPRDEGTLTMLVRRPTDGEREILEAGTLTSGFGLEGDNWAQRPNEDTADGRPDPDSELNVTNSRVAAAVAPDAAHRALFGDQLHLDLDLSMTNLPAGSRLHIGSAVLEVTAKPHTGCLKFLDRFGKDALRWISTPEGLERRMRGLNAKVVTPGEVRVGDSVRVERPA